MRLLSQKKRGIVIKVTHFIRKPKPSYFSIEGLFQVVRQALPADIQAQKWMCPHLSEGIWNRLFNLIAARNVQSEVNHITGDVHYLAIGLNAQRTILTVHDAALLDRLTGLRRRVYKFFWFDWPMRRSAMVSVISEATRVHLLKNVDVSPDKIRVVPDCISEAFEYTPKPFPSEAPRILQIGTKKNKNIERVAQSLNGLQCELRIIGILTDLQKAALDEAGVTYSNVYNLSEEALVAEYISCDLLIFASLIEGFGMPIIEAQAVGRPVVTSNCSSMPEVAGEGACFVNPNSVQSIREGIERVIQHKRYREDLISKGLVNAARFTPQRIAEQYAVLYREIAER